MSKMEALFPNNGLMTEGPPEGMEYITDYEHGGHHPVHLGDHLGKDGRYRVIHKLGYGGFALVWLCRDLDSSVPKYVALKVIMADASTDSECRELHVNNKLKKIMRSDQNQDSRGQQKSWRDHICLHLDQFQIDGPNGSHLCFVYPVTGPRVSRVMREPEAPDKALRRISFQAVQAMALLHEYGFFHGDFTPSNILLRISGLDGLSEEDIIKILGEPETTKVVTYDGKDVFEPMAPKYLVRPVDFDQLDSQFVMDTIYVIDFGESFEAAQGPLDGDLGTPGPYRSPELLLDNEAGIASDLWALGCTLFTIRTGRKLFDAFDDDMDDYLYRMVLHLGALPEPWWSTTWGARREFFKDEPDTHGRAVMTDATRDEHERLDPREDLSIEDTLKKGLFYLNSDEQGRIKNISRCIPDTEIDIFADLLKGILQLEPGKRLPAAEILEHEWFKL